MAIIIVILLSAVGVVGDAILKLASKETNMFANRWFVLGAAIFASSAMGWVWAMRHLKLAEIGAIYGAATILLLVVVGVVLFGERLILREVLGICCALAAVLLLWRFA